MNNVWWKQRSKNRSQKCRIGGKSSQWKVLYLDYAASNPVGSDNHIPNAKNALLLLTHSIESTATHL